VAKSKKPQHRAFPFSGKQPIAARDAVDRKVPRALEGASYHSLRPSWRISLMEMVDPFGWHRVDAPTIHYIRQRLALFETMTWSEILVQAKKQNHSIQVTALCTEAQQRLMDLQLLVEDVVSLRLSGRERVYGYLENGVLVVLWWDPLHQICPSLKG
jgi:hypothetical protein